MRRIYLAFANLALLSAPSAAQEAQVGAPQVQLVDAREETVNDARFLAATVSRDRLAIVVWGGNRAIQQEAYFAALDLAEAGIPVAFLVGPDGNGIDADAYMQIYAASTPHRSGTIANNGSERIRPLARQGGLEAYQEAFPAEWRELQARRR